MARMILGSGAIRKHTQISKPLAPESETSPECPHSRHKTYYIPTSHRHTITAHAQSTDKSQPTLPILPDLDHLIIPLLDDEQLPVPVLGAEAVVGLALDPQGAALVLQRADLVLNVAVGAALAARHDQRAHARAHRAALLAVLGDDDLAPRASRRDGARSAVAVAVVVVRPARLARLVRAMRVGRRRRAGVMARLMTRFVA